MRNCEDYEENAAECRRLAAQMKNPKLKKRLDDMADVWDRLARQRRQGIVENNPDQFRHLRHVGREIPRYPQPTPIASSPARLLFRRRLGARRVEAVFLCSFFRKLAICGCLSFKVRLELNVCFVGSHLLELDCVFQILSEHFHGFGFLSRTRFERVDRAAPHHVKRGSFIADP